MKTKIIASLLCFFIALSFTATAQGKPKFWDEIEAFKKQDSINPPPKNPIVFTGSSSIRMWSTLKEDFPNRTVINRGFGGSTLPDVIQYEDEVITNYKPKQIVFFCGENDIAAADSVTGSVVFTRFLTLFKDIRKKLGDVPFVFISIKPSPSRWQHKTKMIVANELIKKYLETQKKTVYVDVWTPMLNADGNPREELFREDRLHMKPEGYAIWKAAVEPKLLK